MAKAKITHFSPRKQKLGRYAKKLVNKGFTFNPQKPPSDSEGFYTSRAWYVLRYKTLLHYGRICMCCGKSGGNIQVDHIKPRSRYPELQLKADNLQVLCYECNQGKGADDETDFRSERFTPKTYKGERKP
jgi:hypothetical protein